MAMPQAMAFQQPFAAQANKGTLMPGQTISVNKYTVQVERYLSQGMYSNHVCMDIGDDLAMENRNQVDLPM